MKRLVAIIFIVVVLLIIGATPVLADGNGPPYRIRNHTDTPGMVIYDAQSQGPPYYIYIWLPSQSHADFGAYINIYPTSSPAG